MIATVPPRFATRRPPSRLALVLFGIGLVSLLLMSTVALVAYVWPRDERPTELRGNRVVGTVDEFARGSVTFLGRRGIPAYLVRFQDGSFRAYEQHEPVFGCSLIWYADKGIFRDPCHGLEYDIDGKPLRSYTVPAVLRQFEVNVSSGAKVRIDLDHLTASAAAP